MHISIRKEDVASCGVFVNKCGNVDLRLEIGHFQYATIELSPQTADSVAAELRRYAHNSYNPDCAWEKADDRFYTNCGDRIKFSDVYGAEPPKYCAQCNRPVNKGMEDVQA